MTECSVKPLVDKLGIKEGFRVYIKNAPDDYLQLISPVPNNVKVLHRLTNNLDLVHFFVTEQSDLVVGINAQLSRIKQDGMIWVSWPKKASKVKTDITENSIRDAILPLGLVDIKVCSVNNIWSGLKLVIRKEYRTHA